MNTFKHILVSSVLVISQFTYAGPKVELSGTGSLEVDVEDLDQIKDWGSLMSIRDLELRADASLTEWLSARVTLACEEKPLEDVGDCVESARDILKDFTIGFLIPKTGNQKLAVLIGKTAVPFGGNVSQRNVVRNNQLDQANRELERKKAIIFQWAPSIGDGKGLMNELFQLVEVAAYSSTPLDNFSDLTESDYDNYAVRISGALKKVFYQASMLDEKSGDKRWSVSAGMNIGEKFTVYGEYQHYENNAVDPDRKAATTVGATREFGKGTGYAEVTQLKTVSGVKPEDRMAIGYRRPVTGHMTVGAEVDSELDGDDRTATVSLTGGFGAKRSNINSPSMFPELDARTQRRNASMDKNNKAKQEQLSRAQK